MQYPYILPSAVAYSLLHQYTPLLDVSALSITQPRSSALLTIHAFFVHSSNVLHPSQELAGFFQRGQFGG